MNPLKINHTFSCDKDWDEMAGESAHRHALNAIETWSEIAVIESPGKWWRLP